MDKDNHEMSTSAPGQRDLPRAFPLPTISEDTLHYTIHVPPITSTSNTETEPSPNTSIEAFATLITSYVYSLLIQPWLWNKDEWELKVDHAWSTSKPTTAATAVGGVGNEGAGSKLTGIMRVGDAVDDEWLVVWLLKKVSERWPKLVISVRDTDGEFMLIEAADELPSWLQPENAENRLWIQGGHLHLLPLNVKSSISPLSLQSKQIRDEDYDDTGHSIDPDAWVSEEDAVVAVREGKYRAPDNVEKAVWSRIDCYPDALRTHQHRTLAYLPINIAKALKSHPELIQRAVESFYVRDPAQLRAAARMSHFPPSPAVLSSVLMTRAAYAQLQGQIFHPPRVFGPEWHVRDPEEEKEGSAVGVSGLKEEKIKREKERKWRDLGVKIATGFEIMYREGGKKGRAADTEGNVDDYKMDPEYQKYIATLKRTGFFGNELEGSEKWKIKEVEALHGWRAVRSSDTTQERQSFAYLVDKAIANAPDTLDPITPETKEDDDPWLEMSPVELDAMMMRISGQKNKDQDEKLSSAAPARAELGEEHGKALKDLADKVQEFVGGQGDLQGARFVDELSDDDDDEEEEDVDMVEMTPEEREKRLAELVPGIPVDQWGFKRFNSETSDVDIIDSTTLVTGKNSTSRKLNQSKVVKSVSRNGETLLSNALLPAKMRPPVFEKQHFDGVETDSSDEDDGEVDEEDLPPPGTIGRRIAMMKWGEGVDTSARIEEIDDEPQGGGGEKRKVAFKDAKSRRLSVGKQKLDEEMEGLEELDEEEKEEEKRRKFLQLNLDGIDEEMRRRVWGGSHAGENGKEEDADEESEGEEGDGMDLDGIYEEEEFLKFSRDALGIDEEMWQGILKSRKDRGAFVPESQSRKQSQTTQTTKPQTVNPSNAPNSKSTTSLTKPLTEQKSGQISGGPNMALNSFDAVMRAMDAELARANRVSRGSQPTPLLQEQIEDENDNKDQEDNVGVGSGRIEDELDQMNEDELAAMDRELRSALKGAGASDDDDEGEGEGEWDPEVDPMEARELRGDQKREYKMMRDFLESYRSQNGGSGVVGNLFGRLGKDIGKGDGK